MDKNKLAKCQETNYIIYCLINYHNHSSCPPTPILALINNSPSFSSKVFQHFVSTMLFLLDHILLETCSFFFFLLGDSLPFSISYICNLLYWNIPFCIAYLTFYFITKFKSQLWNLCSYYVFTNVNDMPL